MIAMKTPIPVIFPLVETSCKNINRSVIRGLLCNVYFYVTPIKRGEQYIYWYYAGIQCNILYVQLLLLNLVE